MYDLVFYILFKATSVFNWPCLDLGGQSPVCTTEVRLHPRPVGVPSEVHKVALYAVPPTILTAVLTWRSRQSLGTFCYIYQGAMDRNVFTSFGLRTFNSVTLPSVTGCDNAILHNWLKCQWIPFVGSHLAGNAASSHSVTVMWIEENNRTSIS
jgi:hypothetical protein